MSSLTILPFIGDTSPIPSNRPNESREKDADENDSNVVYESMSSRIARRRMTSRDTESDIDLVEGCPLAGMEVAVKSLTQPCPSHEDLSCLNNEYHILTRYLASCSSSARRALGRRTVKPSCEERAQSVESPHVIYLEWVDGMTLQDLISRWQSKGAKGGALSRCDPNNITPPIDTLFVVQIMHKIALALADIHEAGVIHNDIATDNIITSFNMEADIDSVSVKIIDFGYATTTAMSEANDSGETVNDDLYNLGAVFREFLLATTSNPASDSTRSSLTRGSISRMGDEILPFTVPQSLRNVVSCLSYCTTDSSNPPYKSAKEVAEDLEQMLDSPDNFLYEFYREHDVAPNLMFKPDKAYGRSNEVTKLLNAYEQIKYSDKNHNNNDEGEYKGPDMILVSGYGGSGKTTLVQSLKDPVIKSGGYYISGKFDALQRNEPYSALIRIFSDICTAILESSNDTIKAIRTKIMSAVGSDAIILTELIPNLHMIMERSNKENGKEGEQNPFTDGCKEQNKLNFVVRRFMRAVATHDHPLVIVLDDLHLADTASLNLLQSIVTDSENKSPLLFVGCYRNTELEDDHPLLSTLGRVEKLKRTTIKKKLDVIDVNNLNREDINVMISDAIVAKRRVTRTTLTNLIYQKTDGNPLFTVQFLKSLQENGLMFFDPELKRWLWDEKGIQTQNVSNGVVELLAHKIRTRLSESARNTLKLAACIGSTFDTFVLAMVNAATEESVCCDSDQVRGQSNCIETVSNIDDLSKRLDELVEEGLLMKKAQKSQYKFAHDRVHQAAYGCIPDEDRAALHHQIGEFILKTINSPKRHREVLGTGPDDALLHILVDQLNRGSVLINDKSEKISLAALNLKVGEICVKKTSFQTAESYLDAGIRLLDQKTCWQEHYSLALRLHNLSAEVHHSTGKFEAIPNLLEKVFIHAESLEDKLSAYSTQMLVTGAEGKSDESIKIGLNALAELGEHFPKSVSRRTILLDVIKTKWVLKNRGETSLLKSPMMTDKTKIAAMHFLSTMAAYCTASRSLLFPLVICRMVRISITHGICEASAFAFAWFGFLLCSRLGNTKSGYKYGHLSLSLLRKCGGREWVAKIYCVVSGFIDCWLKCPLLGDEALLDGYTIGMQVGDLEYASLCGFTSIRISFFDGDCLVSTEKRTRIFCHELAEYSQGLTLRIVAVFWQAQLNLLGKSKNPTELVGEAIDFDASINTEIQERIVAHQTIKVCIEIYMAYLFGRNEQAAEKSKQAQILFSSGHSQFPIWRHFFMYYDCSNDIDLATSTNERKFEVKARNTMKEIKKLATKFPRTFLHKYYLIEAKYAMMKGKMEKAARKFNTAISSASTAGFCNDEALANEQAGIYFMKVDKKEKASQCFAKAHQCYLKWGAQAKADHLYDCWMSN